MPEPVFMKLGMHIMAPEVISMAYFINTSHQSVCIYVYPLIVARQRLVKHIPTGANTRNNRRIVGHVCLCVCLCILLSLLGNNSVKTFPWQWKIVQGIIFCAVCVIRNESRWLVLPRISCFVGYFLLSVGFLSPLFTVYTECWATI
jgi:hypothetical protein